MTTSVSRIQTLTRRENCITEEYVSALSFRFRTFIKGGMANKIGFNRLKRDKFTLAQLNDVFHSIYYLYMPIFRHYDSVGNSFTTS